MNDQSIWDHYYLEEAHKHAQAHSKDPGTRVGAILVRDDHSEIARGFNGFPKGIDETPERFADRDFKMAIVLHAEEIAIDNADEPLHGATVYVSPYQPCAHCASRLINKGIKRVVTDMTEHSGRWSENFKISSMLFAEAGVRLDFINQQSGV